MFGYLATLGPEARLIVQHLVSEYGLEDQAQTSEVGERLGLSETELGDGLDELVQLDIITAFGPYRTVVMPKAAAWLYVDSEILGYDLRADMRAVAESTAGREKAKPEEIEADTGLNPNRINVAAHALQYESRIHLVKFTGRNPYGFSEAWATRETRGYIRQPRP